MFKETLDSIEKILYKYVLYPACVITGIAMVVSVVLQVLNRYLPLSATWTEESSRLTFVWFCFICVGMAYVERGHLAIDSLTRLLPKKVAKVYEYVPFLFVLGLSILITVKGFEMSLMVMNQHSPIMGLSFFWFNLAVPVSFGFITLFSFMDIVKMLMGAEVLPIEGESQE